VVLIATDGPDRARCGHGRISPLRNIGSAITYLFNNKEKSDIVQAKATRGGA
jgi:hypothetical protein